MKILEYGQPGFAQKLKRACPSFRAADEIAETVRTVIADVEREGDKAVFRYTEKFDKAKLTARTLRVKADELSAAPKTLTTAQRKAIKEAIHCVKDFHRKTMPQSWHAKNPHGATVGEAFFPIQRVGLYVPGGQVPLVSTVIMSAVLAKLAGCPEVAVCTPPGKDGSVSPSLLAALHLCGVEEVYKIGGVQALAALAIGTKTVPAVDKVFGPGNAYVMEAKRALFGRVGVDLLPGPSEVLIIGDSTSNPAFIAADLLAQAEHGTGKEKVFLIVESREQAAAIQAEITAQAETLSHRDAALGVLKHHGFCVIASDLEAIAEIANYIAPEHLELQVKPDSRKILAKKITTAGAMLIGGETPTVLGDFTAGPSHTLPTDRTGRFFGGMQVTDYMRRTSIVEYDAKSIALAWPVVRAFAEMEQLDAHGRSLEMRLEK
ncbi:histidinol dehydrogenase [Cerasicoccus arenae]|uniref:Histidinol dehydrogenase n=1 Tax=Cerasicoccus arenae TaxID=424488 RepID=A0A8J3GG24_9BACT|nr:histidinol dehydrogenase [Cerasicoccus arenae]MBK1858495.1 histidinol dehydrogenase [Cerasicoccus arenae]GHC10283.1 histidinol dehydrogenase [Cerasicoccus arenae]